MDGEERIGEKINGFLLGELGRQEEVIEAQAGVIVRLSEALRRYLETDEIEEIKRGCD